MFSPAATWPTSFASSGRANRPWPNNPLRIGIFFVLLFGEMVSESRRTSSSIYEQGCNFPADWEGIWFQSTVRPYITIQGHTMSSKGACVESSGKSTFSKNPMIVSSVSSSTKRPGTSSSIKKASDAPLLPTWTLSAASSLATPTCTRCSAWTALPFPVPSTARSSSPTTGARASARGRGPRWSRARTRTDSVFHYQACPNVQGSEMMTEELECQATWRDGSSHYLVGKLSHAHASTDEDKFRCFVFEFANPLVPSEGLHLAQSGDATCNGVFSPREGPRTLSMQRGRSKANCRFARWFSSMSRWTSLDHGRSLVLSPEAANASFMSMEQTNMKRNGLADYVVRETSQVLCHKRMEEEELQSEMRVILYQTIGCKNGFVCAEFQLKTDSVLSAKLGIMSRTAEYACDNGHFASKAKSKLLVASSSLQDARGRRILEPGQETPFSGLYRMSPSSSSIAEDDLLLPGGRQDLSVAAEVRASERLRDRVAPCIQDDDEGEGEDADGGLESRSLALVFGCGKDRTGLEIRASCPGDGKKDNFLRGYTLIHKWNETRSIDDGRGGGEEAHQYLIFRPKVRSSSSSSGGESLLCFRFLASPDLALQQQQQQKVIMTKLDENCLEPQAAAANAAAALGGVDPGQKSSSGHQMVLTFEGDCSQVSSGGGRSVWRTKDRLEQRAKLFIILFNLSLFCCSKGPQLLLGP